MLRGYQQNAHNEVIKWLRATTLPCVVEAATGAGKSHIIAAIAKSINQMSGKRVLCLAPSGELVEQNHEKYLATGNPASMFSASVGQKSLRHPVVFGTPMTVKNKISRFGSEFALIIVDEGHGITPTIRDIIDKIRDKNPNVRVVLLSATPYRMLTGYIFAQWPDGKPVGEHQAKEPYAERCVYRITARELIDDGYLTPPTVGAINAEAYHTLDMQVNRMGQFNAADVDRAFVGQGRKTAAVIADVVHQSRDRQGVMIFAATVQHAQECMASLPPELSAIVTEKTKKADRRDILKRFKARQIKYLVNVSVLTVGFDATHVDVIAILRATESPGLLQQIIGRGLRLHPGKVDCMVLDYAENIERHCLDGDIFNPDIKVRMSAGGSSMMTCNCPECGEENEFSARPNEGGYDIDDNGYFVDLDKNRVPTDFGDMPAHYGRRCQHRWVERNIVQRCNYRWTFKECPSCMADNDIAARYCSECKGEIVDPGEKLVATFKALKKDPTQLQTDLVKEWSVYPTMSTRGKEMDRIDVVTPYRSFSVWIARNPSNPYQLFDREKFDKLMGSAPRTVTYKKDKDTGFFKIVDYNRPEDFLHPVVNKPIGKPSQLELYGT